MAQNSLPSDLLHLVAEEVSADVGPFLLLQDGLMEAQDKARSNGNADSGRGAALTALSAVVRFLQACPEINRLQLHAPLHTLMSALVDVAMRQVRHPMFEIPADTASNALPFELSRLHATAAAWAEALKLKGLTAGDAEATVAEALKGYTTRNGRVTSATVKQWRKQARQPTPRGIDVGTYRHMLAVFVEFPPDAITPAARQSIRNLFSHLFA